jgi:MPBQ/MSBQ methyltransferase
MLFPSEAEYRAWFERAGFEDVRVEVLAPDWYRGRSPYGVAIAGTRGHGPAPPAPEVTEERPAGRARFAARFVLGSAAGAAFVPIGAALALRARLARRPR